MTLHHWSLEEIAAWGAKWSALGRREDFLHPHPHIWPEDPGRLPELVRVISASLSSAELPRFHQAVLASLALTPHRPKLCPLLQCFLDPAASGLPLTLAELAAMSWIRVPTLLANAQKGQMRFVLMGRSRSDAPFTLERMDLAAAESVQLALSLAGVPGICVWPIVEPGILGPALLGNSLGLPVTLGAWLLRQDLDWPQGLVCTGGLSRDGWITPVDNVPIKARTAAIMGFRALFHPQGSFAPGQTNRPASLACVEVRGLNQARALAACFDPAHIPEMAVLLGRRQGQDGFLDAAAAVPVAFLDYLSGEDPDFQQRLSTACLRPENAMPLLERLAARMADHSLPLAEISGHLRLFFPFEIWRSHALDAPGTGAVAARLHMEAANHQGLIRESARWEPVLRQACERLFMLRDNRGEELLAALYAMVAGLHNRYAFTIAGLEPAIRPLTGILNELEQTWRARRQRCPDVCHNVCHDEMGRFHGTLAQHYGFCGPSHLASVEKHVRLAQEAFGNGRVAEKRADWRRGFSYLFHARLDAGCLDTLRATLEAYLDQPLEGIDFHQMDKFEHYHLAKYLGLAGNGMSNLPHAYQQWAAARLPEVGPDHPWPLWALNLGKAATTSTDKARFLEASLRLLRAAPGPTVRVMTLMPLAWLAHAGLMDPEEAAREAKDMVEEIQASGLDQDHFAVLFGLPGANILEKVLENEARLFPFGYR